jgi:hypothetical protein
MRCRTNVRRFSTECRYFVVADAIDADPFNRAQGDGIACHVFQSSKDRLAIYPPIHYFSPLLKRILYIYLFPFWIKYI